jgi:hypothetical protein
MTIGRQAQPIASFAEMTAQGADKADLSFGFIKSISLRRVIQRIAVYGLKGNHSLNSVKNFPCRDESLGCPGGIILSHGHKFYKSNMGWLFPDELGKVQDLIMDDPVMMIQQ